MSGTIKEAYLLFKKNKYQKVIDICNKILTDDVNSREALRLIAKSFLAIRKVEDSRFYFNKLLNQTPNDYEILKEVGNTYVCVGDLNNAKHYYQQSISFNPRYVPSLCNLGLLNLQLNNTKEAIILLNKAIDINPKMSSAWGNLANAYFQAGDKRESENCCLKALKLNPNQFNINFLLATIFSSQNKYKEAEISLKKTINIKPSFYLAYSELSILLRKMNKLEEAKIWAEKSIKINSKDERIYSNLGLIYKDMGNLKEAEICLIKAIGLDSKNHINYANLASILKLMGNIEKAEFYLRNAINLNPEEASLYNNLANILIVKGKESEAFDVLLKAIKKEPNEILYLSSIIELLSRGITLTTITKEELRELLINLFNRDDVPHRDLCLAFFSVYDTEKIKELVKFNSNYFYSNSITNILNDDLFCIALEKTVFRSAMWERLLTKIRKDFLEFVILEESSYYLYSKFIFKLADQCFHNEYIFTITKEEINSLNIILDKCKNGQVNEILIATIACYRALYKIKWLQPLIKSLSSNNEDFNQLLKVQLFEPLEELEISKNLNTIGNISNHISLKVKSQYEDNPYPRWKSNYVFSENKYDKLEIINTEIKPNFIEGKKCFNKIKVLIAGCGTGHQIFQAQRYKNVEITAIDLSTSSLSYAKRKLDEFGIENVNLINMDLLDLDQLNQKFDIIECGGVLHHMEDPHNGLKALLKVAKKDTFLKIALYSEIANKDVIQTCKYIYENKLDFTKDDLTYFREKVFAGDIQEIVNCQARDSFYTTSECRDLYFHAQAHRYSINQINHLLKSERLDFIGFLLPYRVKNLFKSYFPDDLKQINLENWNSFEKKYSRTFEGKYQFWVRRL